jgi:thiol-disulfide isomerase/thioredoxin
MMKTASKGVQTSVHFWAKFWLVLCLAFTSISAQAVEVGDTLIIDQVTTLDGHVITDQELKGKHVIIEVWATWCPFCHRQNQNLVELVKMTQGMPLQVIGLSIDKKQSDVEAYVEKNKINFPNAMMTPELSKAIGKRRGIPELYVIDPAGKVLQKDYGEMIDLDVFDLANYVKK